MTDDVLLTLLLAGPAGAQSYPNRSIRMIVPFTSGGGVDIVARSIAQKMSEKLGQPVTVENRAGADTMLGVRYAF